MNAAKWIIGIAWTAAIAAGSLSNHRSVAANDAACPFTRAAENVGLAFDGCTDAAIGPPQHPMLLTRYGSHRPRWNVAGVDYHVGMPAHVALKDWKNIEVPGIDVVNDYVRCNGMHAAKRYGGTVRLEGIDFTTHGGAKAIYVPAQGCSALVISDSRFGDAGQGTGCDGFSWYQIQSQNDGASIVIMRNTFDMTKCRIGNAAIIVTAGPVTIWHNYFGHFQGQILQAPAGPYSIDYRFNLIEDGCYHAGNHMNFQEFGGAVSARTDLVAFNTTYEYDIRPCGGEEFQFYGNQGGVLSGASLMNNTIIALDPGNCRSAEQKCPVSYAIHGTGAYNPRTSLSGPAYNRDNYFDVSGMYGAYYPHSMDGWISSNNIDMNSGRVIQIR